MSKSDRIIRKVAGIGIIGSGCWLVFHWGGVGLIALSVALCIGLDCLDDKEEAK